MLYKKFETNDLFFNTLKAKPRFEFKIWGGRVNSPFDTYYGIRSGLSSSQESSVLLDGLGGYWKLDGDANDSLGVNNGSGSLTGWNWTTAGKINQAFNKDSAISTGYINLGSGSALKPTTAISLSAWFNFSGSVTANSRIISDWHQDGTRDRWIFGYSTDGNQILWHKAGVSVGIGTIGSTITTGSWVHLAVTWNQASGSTTYLNGAVVNSGITTGGDFPAGLDRNVTIGNQEEISTGMYGAIDEFGIWGRCLSSDEITMLYNNGDGLSYPF